MQKDMHYHGTYALAIAAGLNAEAAGVIATASQFVDDCAGKSEVKFKDAGGFVIPATAHHPGNLIKNNEEADQRQVWVPFHFLPGAQGDSFTEKLICRKDSAIAKAMMEAALEALQGSNGLYRLGIAAHVYADTFAHYGFSGVSSRWNRVVGDSITLYGNLDPDIEDYIKGKANNFFKKFAKECTGLTNIKSTLAEAACGALGHAGAATFPDRPFLNWGFTYEYPQNRASGARDNQASFLEYCRAMFALFSRAVAKRPDIAGDSRQSFSDIEPAVRDVLSFQGKLEDRANAWKSAAVNNRLSLNAFDIPDYRGTMWLDEKESLNGKDISTEAFKSPLYHYCMAAADHRHYVLQELLPEYKLVVA